MKNPIEGMFNKLAAEIPAHEIFQAKAANDKVSATYGAGNQGASRHLRMVAYDAKGGMY